MKTDAVSSVIKSKTDQMYSLLNEKDFDGAEMVANEIDILTKNRNADTVRAGIIIRRGRNRNA